MRPNAGIVEPGDEVEVLIILQGFSQPLPHDYKCKDKFLIVSLPAPKVKDPSRVGDEWLKLELQYGDKMVSKKLRVNYYVTDDASEDDQAAPASNGRNGHEAAAAGAAGAGAAAVATGASRSGGQVLNQAPIDLTVQQRLVAQPAAPAAAAPAPQQYLVPAQNGGDYPPQKVITTEPVQGISIQLAALLCVLSFLVGWIVF